MMSGPQDNWSTWKPEPHPLTTTGTYCTGCGWHMANCQCDNEEIGIELCWCAGEGCPRCDNTGVIYP